ncbi:MAG: exodeoxyribonuclease V subunit beta [bacterium]
MKTLDVHTVPLTAKNLIEASAGTGKTWTLSYLYLRFILQKNFQVSQILVVTYTNAATEELRDRIRRRLIEAKQAFMQPHQARYEYAELIKHCPNYSQAIARLQKAILNFDEATVFTIHGFCQRVLVEQAFEANLPFDHELTADDYEMMLALVDKYWREHLQHADDALSQLLVDEKITPDQLLADIQSVIGKPYLKPLIDSSEANYESLFNDYQQAEDKFRQAWKAHSDEALQLLRENVSELNGTRIKIDYINTRQHKIQQWIEESLSLPLDEIEKFTQDYIKKATKKNCVMPKHLFFSEAASFFKVADHFFKVTAITLNQLRLHVLNYLREELPRQKRQRGLLSFDDLLLELQLALERNPNLAAILKKKYPVALIDEFQDTDPIQYAIFAKIYGRLEKDAGSLFFVGDPKQAIYSFRGADIFTYLKAAEAVDQQYTLDTNYRSHPKLIAGLNHIYHEANEPFFYRQIQYKAVKAGKGEEPRLVTAQKHRALQLYHWAEDSDKDKKADLMRQIATAVAHEIAQLLNDAQQGRAYIQNKSQKTPLQGGDFAILVRSHMQGSIIKKALTAVGVASVQQSQQSIFCTPEAEELQRILLAIIHFTDEARLRYALLSNILGYSGDDLLDLSDQAWDRLFAALYELHQLWDKQGFMSMFQRFLRYFTVQERLLNQLNGERHLTNLLHLGELLHQQDRRQSYAMHHLLHWLKTQMQSSGNEETQLRLESDENLVQIVTIHKSKGLEYPLVYCPFLWADESKATKEALFTFHHPESSEACLEAGSSERERWAAITKEEAEAENQRLLYVALTRPRFHCSLVVVSQKKSYFSSAIAKLLWSSLNLKQLFSKKSKVDPYEVCDALLNDLVADHTDCIATEPLYLPEKILHYQAEKTAVHYQARQFPMRPLIMRQQMSSFSALVTHSQQPHYEYTDQTVEKDWNDGQTAKLVDYELVENDIEATTHPEVARISDFPTGARAGSCLHDIFEHLNFYQALEKQNETVILPTLEKWGYGLAEQPAALDLLQQSLYTPLNTKQQHLFCLAQLENGQRCNELEFYFPLTQLTVKHLRGVLLRYLPNDWYSIRQACQQLHFDDLRGFMRGFIDLIYEREGRYGIVDYKSNTLVHYDQDHLHQAMAESHYYLQYLIYCIALHRYLRLRIADYTWDKHSDGVYYLFIRGLQITSPQEIKNNDQPLGVFFHQPSAALIQALDDIF